MSPSPSMGRLRKKAAEGGARYDRLAPGSVILEILKAENFAPTDQAAQTKGKHNYAMDTVIRVVESNEDLGAEVYDKIFTGQYKSGVNKLGGTRGWLVVTDPTNEYGFDKQLGNVSNFQDAAVESLGLADAFEAAQAADAKRGDDEYTEEDNFWANNPVFADRGGKSESVMKGVLVRAVTHWQVTRRGASGMCVTRFYALDAEERGVIEEVWASKDADAIAMLDYTAARANA